MNEAVETVVEQPSQAVVQQSQSEPEPAPLSIMEHAKLHGDQKDKTSEGEKAALADKAAHHSEAQRREKETGKFEPGKVRHRARSQQAGPEDVPRIAALTARAKGAEERLDAANRELEALRRQHASPAQIDRAERRVEQAEVKIAPVVDESDPEPKEDDPKYGGDYGKYLVDNARWAARDERRQWDAKQAREAESTRQRETEQATIRTFGERIAAAKTKYADFETVAFGPSPIPVGSPTDAFIMEDDNGADVLYHLHSHLDELQKVLQMPVLQQLKHLALLSQRFDTKPETAGLTGAATRPVQVKLAPRPATPVRTEAHSVSGPPPTDGTLSVLGHAKAFRKA